MQPTITDHHIALLRRAVLQHDPERYGLMQSEASAKRGKKYIEYAEPLDIEQALTKHLLGQATYAVPASEAGVAACIVYDVDGYATQTLPIMLYHLWEQGLWAWAELDPQRDRGYVWVPFEQLLDARQLKAYGDTLIAGAPLTPEQRAAIDNRTANQAITRLPFGVHTWIGRRLLVLFPDNTADTEADITGTLDAWGAALQLNPAERVPALPKPPAPKPLSQPALRARATNDEIKAAYNQRFSVLDVLEAHGYRRASRTSYHCKCPGHQHDDQRPSLLIRPARLPKYGSHIVQGYAPGCRFFSEGKVWDTFNVEMELTGRSYGEQLAHARRMLGMEEPPPRSTGGSTPPASGEQLAHARRMLGMEEPPPAARAAAPHRPAASRAAPHPRPARSHPAARRRPRPCIRPSSSAPPATRASRPAPASCSKRSSSSLASAPGAGRAWTSSSG